MKTQCNISQNFGGNATATYKAGGLLGHSGVDQDCGFGSPIYSIWDKEYVYKLLTKEHPSNDGTGFTGVFTIVEINGYCFEFLYGHGNPSPGILGKTITKGTVIGTQANNGEVYSGCERITLEMQKNGDTRGTHRHDQARMLRKDTSIQANTRYLTDLSGGYLYLNGFFYAIPDYNNGYNGCFDWTKFDFTSKNLTPQHVTDFITALTMFQKAEGIDPYPIIGKKTTAALKKYKLI